MDFIWPLALCGLILLPVIVLLYLLAQRKRSHYAVKFTNLALLREVAGRQPHLRRHIPPVLYLGALTAMIVGMARPEMVLRLPKPQSAVMLVVDVSRSMEATDLSPDRLTAAKSAAKRFVDTAPKGMRIGLISFAEGANLVQPLTEDREGLVKAIDRLKTRNSTAIGEGIQLAVDSLPAAGEPTGLAPSGTPTKRGSSITSPGNVLLLTDGENNRGVDPLEAADDARTAGVKVYTIGIGSPEGSNVVINGEVSHVSLDERTLRRIAETTGANYHRAASADDLRQIYAGLGSAVGWTEERTEVTVLATGVALALTIFGVALSVWWFHRLP